MDQVRIGKWISLLRKEKKLTQEQLAERLGVSNRSVSRWENGRCMPDFSLLWDIAGELGVSVSELLNGKRMEEEESAEVLGCIDALLAWSGREKRYKAKRLGQYFGAGMVCLLLALGQAQFGAFSFLFPLRTEELITGILAALGVTLGLIGLSCNRQNALLTKKEIQLLSKNGGNVRMRNAQEMLRFAQKYREADQKCYRAAFTALEKNLEQGEEAVFSAVGDAYIRNELPMMWYAVLAVTGKRLLIGGQRMKGMIMVRYEVESFLLHDITWIGQLGAVLVIRTSREEIKIEVGDIGIVSEMARELQSLLGKEM